MNYTNANFTNNVILYACAVYTHYVMHLVLCLFSIIYMFEV
jgi:hypothetical protein